MIMDVEKECSNIKFGRFTFYDIDDDYVWIERNDGNGSRYKKSEIESIIFDYYKSKYRHFRKP